MTFVLRIGHVWWLHCKNKDCLRKKGRLEIGDLKLVNNRHQVPCIKKSLILFLFYINLVKEFNFGSLLLTGGSYILKRRTFNGFLKSTANSPQPLSPGFERQFTSKLQRNQIEPNQIFVEFQYGAHKDIISLISLKEWSVSFSNFFSTRIPKRNKWKNTNALDKRAIANFIDCSKLEEKVGCRIHSPMLLTNMRMRLPPTPMVPSKEGSL